MTDMNAFDKAADYLISQQPRNVQHVETALAALRVALDTGSILNPVYQDAKFAVSRAVEDAWRKAVPEKWIYVKQRENLPCDVKQWWDKHDFGLLYLHTLRGKLKLAEKATIDHPLRDDILTFLRSVAPVADAFAALKDKVVKRQPKPVEEKKTGYQPPKVSTKAQKQVVELLEGVTQQAYEGLKSRIIRQYVTWEADYLAVQSIANKHGFSLSPAEYFLSRRFPNRIAYEAVSAVVEQRRVDALSIYFSMKDRETKLRALATEMADEIRMSFVYKNFRKLAFIVDAKGNLKSAIAREHTISLNGLTGTFDFTFKDGARFTATNSVVYVVNAYGTRFSRFPLTFHNVRLANGGRLARPSQEKMNTIFARKG